MGRRDVLDRLISTGNPLRTTWMEQLVEEGKKEGYDFVVEEIAARIDEPGRDDREPEASEHLPLFDASLMSEGVSQATGEGFAEGHGQASLLTSE